MPIQDIMTYFLENVSDHVQKYILEKEMLKSEYKIDASKISPAVGG